MHRSDRDVSAFRARCQEASDLIFSEASQGREILVVGHNDADGLSSIGIVSGALLEIGAKFISRSVFRIDEFFETTAEHGGRLITLVDMGSGSLSELRERLGEARLVIIDHHPPEQCELGENWLLVNPHLYGIDGENEVSAAGVAYFVIRTLIAEAHRYSALAVVGALGDLQDKGEKRKLVGLNEEIVSEAVKNNWLSVSEDFIFHGRGFKPIHQSIASTQSPFLPGLSGDEAASLSLLVDAGIELRNGDKWRTVSDLSEEEKSRLYNAVVTCWAKNNHSTEVARDLIGTIYELVNEEESSGLRDAREFSHLLNACGKTGNAWLGISVALGFRGWVLREAQKVVENYRSILKRSLETASKSLEQMHHSIVLRVGSEIDVRQVSSVASIVSSSKLIPPDKPLIVVGQEGSIAKVSARASPKLVAMGLNLGDIMKEAALKFSGRGGGHKIAAGAEIPADRLTLFLVEVDNMVGAALSVSKKQITLDDGA
ncbi:MAG: DHH family phosphoesterase [Nitrososphaerota archaeon]